MKTGFLLDSSRKILEIGFTAVLVAFLLIYGVLQGINSESFSFDLWFFSLDVSFLAALGSVAGFSAFMLFSALLTFYQIKNQKRKISSASDINEGIVAIIPTYKDSDALDISVRSLVNTGVDLKVVPVCEKDDEEGLEKCKKLSESFDEVDYVVNNLYPGTKAGAINCAVERTESDFIGVFDADQHVTESFIRKAVSLLDKNYEVVQGRIVPRPSGLIETLCYYESLMINYVPGRLFVFLTGYKVAGSRGILMQRSTFENLGGYDPDFLTEDMDFTFKCYEEGIRVKALVSEVCTEEAPHSLRDYWGQRKRWIKGHLQVFKTRFKYIFTKGGKLRRIKSAVFCGGIPLGWMFLFILTSKFIALFLLGLNVYAVIPIIILMGIGAGFRIDDRSFLRPERELNQWIGLLTVPLVFPLYGLVSIKSLSELIFRREHSWYQVKKIKSR